MATNSVSQLLDAATKITDPVAAAEHQVKLVRELSALAAPVEAARKAYEDAKAASEADRQALEIEIQRLTDVSLGRATGSPEEAILRALTKTPQSSSDIANAVSFDGTNIQLGRILKALVDDGRAKKTGAKRGTKYTAA